MVKVPRIIIRFCILDIDKESCTPLSYAATLGRCTILPRRTSSIPDISTTRKDVPLITQVDTFSVESWNTDTILFVQPTWIVPRIRGNTLSINGIHEKSTRTSYLSANTMCDTGISWPTTSKCTLPFLGISPWIPMPTRIKCNICHFTNDVYIIFNWELHIKP